MRLLSNVFISIAGISFIVLLGVLIQQRIPKKYSFANFASSAQNSESSVPIALKLPTQKSPLPIVPVQVSQEVWPVSGSGVFFVEGSGVPTQKGNSIYYGHNWNSIFGTLSKVQVGDTIIFYYPDTTEIKVTVRRKLVVAPTNTEVIAQTEDPQVTIYTCTGFLDSKRLVIVAS